MRELIRIRVRARSCLAHGLGELAEQSIEVARDTFRRETVDERPRPFGIRPCANRRSEFGGEGRRVPMCDDPAEIFSVEVRGHPAGRGQDERCAQRGRLHRDLRYALAVGGDREHVGRCEELVALLARYPPGEDYAVTAPDALGSRYRIRFRLPTPRLARSGTESVHSQSHA